MIVTSVIPLTDRPFTSLCTGCCHSFVCARLLTVMAYLNGATGCQAKSLMALEWMHMFLDAPPQNGEQEPLWKRILAIATYLLFWIILSAIGLWLMFAIREVGVELMIFAQLNPWAVRGFDRLAIYVLGLIWFVALMWIEHYLRTGIDKKRLWRNIAKVALVQAVLAAIVFGIRFVVA